MQHVETKPAPGTTSGPAALARNLALVTLVIVNLVLGLSLIAGMMPDNTANAANAQVGRPSEYLMLSSRPIGANQDILYILDTENGWLSVAGQNNNAIFFKPRINLN